MSNDIDVVITWVDNSDPEWKAEYLKHSNKDEDEDVKRHEDLDTLKYVFRGIDSHMPWARKIHLVTCGHIPNWLNMSHPKLAIVRHNQILPEECLPTFNSAAIEMSFINIPDLSEKFIYFNDDTFILKESAPSDFFYKETPNDSLKLCNVFYDGAYSHLLHSMMETFNNELKTKQNYIFRNISKYVNSNYKTHQNIKNILFVANGTFSMFCNQHLAQPHLLSNWKYFFEKYPSIAKSTMRHKFREITDHSQFIFKLINFINGTFNPVKFNETGYIHVKSNAQLVKDLKNKNSQLMCINESSSFNTKEYSTIKKTIQSFLDSQLPSKSNFEK